VVQLNATDVARNFSSVINRVSAGEEIEIVRNGAAVAELRPPPRPYRLTSAEWRALMSALPTVDGDYARDVESASEAVGPPVGRWPPS
jgi:antitoxin (DNA-binding transcriptional repressor) of toxin-antitoxin stability system